MSALIIIGMLVAIPIFFLIGYFIWETAVSKYGYNIFSLGVIIRGLIALVCLFLSLVMLDSGLQDGSALVWLVLAGIMMLWTFISTLLNTNIFIAFFAIIYQLVAALFIFRLLNNLFKKQGIQ